MLKKFNVFALALLIIGQTILGPMAVSAESIPAEPSAEVVTDESIVSEDGSGEKAETELEESVDEDGTNEGAPEKDSESGEETVINEEGPAATDAEGPVTNEPEETAGKTGVTGKSVTSTESETFAAVEENLIADFDLSYITKNGAKVSIESGSEIEVDLSDMNAVGLKYGLIKPGNLDIANGDTYTIPLTAIAYGITADNKPITIDGVTVATYSIIDNQIVITFNESVNDFDDVKMNVEISGSFNTEVFETVEEVVIEVPYSDGDSFSTTIKAKQKEYDGTDKKEAGLPYILGENDKNVPVERNPEFIDWTVKANDSMGSYENATIIDDLGDHLEIVEGSFEVYQIIRNYKNEEIDRIKIDVTPTITDSGFELYLGAIEDAYEITYTTRVTRPDGGGTHTINNNARIILDGTENKVTDSFTGTWSGDIPTLGKSGNISNANADIIDWQVKYNYGQEELGSDVILTDTLTHGEVKLGTVKVVEVETDIDGNVTREIGIVEVEAYLDEDGNLIIPGLDANGRAYFITFQSTVPVGLDETVTNTIEDNYNNKDDASVTVNTVPTGGKVGEQLVDKDGNPYIEWTITMNSKKVNISDISVRDVFSGEHLKFDASDKSLYELYKDGDKVNVSDYVVVNYTHDDKHIGFHLQINEAGPHEYKFVYRTYYTLAGMNEPDLANDAELIFDGGTGEGIGVDVDYTQDGPKAGISKSGKYVLNESTGLQEIEWTITFNQSKILLENPKITDTFTSENYTYVDGSLSMTENDQPFTDYDLEPQPPTSDGFTLKINKNTNAVYTITYRTTADDTTNVDQVNDVALTWQGGTEKADATVNKRDPGMNKSGAVVINADGKKTVNWTVNFNTNKNVIHNFELTDTNLPNTVEVSDITVTSNGEDVTDQFVISSPTNGEFKVSKNRLEAVSYQLTYSTTLSATEEKEEVKNTASITYTGGSDSKTATIPNPELGVQKEAISIDRVSTPNRINWRITANTDTAKHLVNLVNAVLTDKIPSDQRLVAGTISAVRADDNSIVVDKTAITEEDNLFSIKLPDGPYQYIVTFQTEILESPSVNEKIDRYTNETTLTNAGYDPVSDDAYIDYFADGTNNNNTKTGEVNDDTENIDWKATVNPLGLTINNAKITDQLSGNQTYVIDDNHKIIVEDSEGNEFEEGSDYELTIDEDNHSFTITFNSPIKEPITVSYSTRLNPDLIGNYTVGNAIKLSGGKEDRELSSTTEETSTSQWSYGGGGSGRTVEFTLNKTNTNGAPVSNVVFDFLRITATGSEVPIGGTGIKTDENGKFKIENARAGRYKVTEVSAPDGYVMLTEPIYMIIGYASPEEKLESGSDYIIKITDSNWNEIESDVAQGTGDQLTIINEHEPVSMVLKATKTLEGNKELEAGQFTFELLENDEVIDVKTNNFDGNIIFKEIIYNTTGTYNYQIREVAGNLNGVTYDNQTHNVTVTVTSNEDGMLKTEISYEENVGGIPEFINLYQAIPTSVGFEAKKILDGLNLTEDQFEFELVDETGEVISTALNNVEGQVIFDEITFDEVGEYTYTIREVEGKLGGVDYDTSEFEVTVTVTDDGEGQLIAAKNYVDGPAEFTNTYTPAPDRVVFGASKILEGQTLEENQFDFELVDEKEEVIQTASNNAEGQVIFDEITFDKVGEYSYTIREVQGDLGGVEYDTKQFNFKVTVTDNEEGNLVAAVVEVDGPAEFTNIYTTSPDTAVIEAHKRLSGQDLRAGQFSFELVNESGDVVQTKENNSKGQIIFDEIEYAEPGNYRYTIREVEGEQRGITYDEQEYKVTVNVTDDGQGNLDAIVNYEDGPVQFINTYAPHPDAVVLEGEKLLNGQDLIANQFTFALVNESGNVIQTATNNAEGQVIFDEITYDAPGMYTYIIQEVEGTQGGMTYDDSTYTVVVDVTDEVGQLIATVNYIDGPAIFTNAYEAGPGSVVIEAKKVLEGQSLVKDQFTFQLLNESSEVIQITTNNANGQVIFDEIAFDEVGVYNYTIREVEGTQGGVTYDSTVFILSVEVVDGREGHLIATAKYVDGPAVFNNNYTPDSDGVVIEVDKILEGQNLRNGQFDFELVDESGDVIQTVTNNAEGQVIFDEITYKEVGEHKYTIREVEGVQGGVTYDSTEFEVTVTVTDDGVGQLTATLEFSDEPLVFTNTYVPEPDSVVFEAKKVLEGQDLVTGQFEFELVNESGEVIQTTTNNAEGQIIFAEITYDEVGEYTYIIRELKGVQGGVEYDTSEFEVTVTVTDDGEGRLTATEDYVNGPTVFTNKYTTAPVSVKIEAGKVLNGRYTELEENEFTFELLDFEENVVATETNNIDGVIVFESIEFDKVGSYEFTIREVTGEDQNINYDETVYNVIVEVTDNGEGQLVAETIYDEEPIFINEYNPLKVSVGDYVWIDENKDGLQDDTDTPLEGVVLTIEDENGNPVIDVYGNPVGPTTTDENGYYIFENLPIDHTYTVRIDREASVEALKGYLPTLHEVGDDREIDSSTWEATSRHLTKDREHDPTLDFGFVKELIDLEGTKTWVDGDDRDGKRPEVIKVDLLQNGKVIDVVEVTAKTDWTYSFVDLDKFDEEGVAYAYEVSEQPVPGYTATIDGYDITNTLDPVEPTEPETPVKPEEPSKPETPKTPEKPVGKLPQTGEEQFMYMIALGVFFLATGGLILFRRRKA